MIIIKKKKKGILIEQKWFPIEKENRDIWKVMMYHQTLLDFRSLFFHREEYHTLLTDLTDPLEEIFHRFSSTVKNEIRRAEKEGLEFYGKETLERFVPFYNDFAVAKGLATKSVGELKMYGESLVVTSASWEGKIIAVHSYLMDNECKRVRLLHSGTSRLVEGVDRNRIARGNKYLHYLDMEMFKKEGMYVYDWGGYAYNTVDPGLMGVNKFKASFGGKEVKEFNYYSRLYQFFSLLSRIFTF